MPHEITSAFFAGTGVGIPDTVVTNADLERRMDTTDEWIRTMTGIRERRMADPSQAASDLAAAAANIASRPNTLTMDGQEIFQFAMKMMPQVTEEAIQKAGIEKEEVALVIPHQANIRIIEAAARRLDIPLERFMINIDRYGNTSAASIPIALCEAVETGRIRPGDVIVLTGFGAGLTWGAMVVRWPDHPPSR